ncbi:MAG: Uma2 family endonuclease [Phycisphaerae bacterium]|nr:Uma2 family endonuclease [Phycisphaerae bacterium]
MIARRTHTAEQFLELSDSLGPCELIRGEVLPLSPAAEEHGLVSSNIGRLLGIWAKRIKSGRVVVGETGIWTQRNPDTVRGADVAYLSYARKPRGLPRSKYLDVAPELVVEVVGKGRDWPQLVEKSAEYLAMGVLRVWLVDPAQRSVTILRTEAPQRVLTDSETIDDAEVLPGFSCPVAEFFEE